MRLSSNKLFCPNFSTTANSLLSAMTNKQKMQVLCMLQQMSKNIFSLSSFRCHVQKVAHDCSDSSFLITAHFVAHFKFFLPIVLFFPSTVLPPVSFITYHLLLSPLYTSLPFYQITYPHFLFHWLPCSKIKFLCIIMNCFFPSVSLQV